MKLETILLLEQLGRYCMFYLPHLEGHVTEAQRGGDIRLLLAYMEPWARIDTVREYADEIRRLEGIR